VTEFGGAILADTVGLGKTYVALALARNAQHPVVVAPAALRTMWQDAARRAGTQIRIMTTEGLSRRAVAVSGAPADFFIVDEAHDFRNPRTKRYRALARLVVGAPLVLLSATPVHNRLADLLALLSLFLGTHAWTLSEAERSRIIVRRTAPQVRGIDGGACAPPVVDAPHVIRLDDVPEVLDALTRLPAPVPPRDGGAADALLTIGLIRQWASSTGALRGALRRRLQRAASLEAAMSTGAYPTYRDLRAWCTGDGAVQLAFPEIVIGEIGASGDNAGRPGLDTLLDTVRAHADAVRRLLDRLDTAGDLDGQRALHLRRIVQQHSGSRVVAFATYEDTVRVLYQHLRRDGHVAMLTAAGGVVAGGTIRRAEVIAQFQAGAPPAPAANRIDLLLTTDILSEGVNLQGAGVVVHLDLPWTPARLEQRVGRVARLGSAFERVAVYAVAPPASAESLLAVERMLRGKLAAAGRAVGIAGSIVPSMVGFPERRNGAGAPEIAAEIRSIMSRWQVEAKLVPGEPTPDLLMAAVRSERPGFLAAGYRGERPVLLASVGAGVSEETTTLADAVRLAAGDSTELDPGAARATLHELAAWSDAREAVVDAGLGTVAQSPVRRRVLARIAGIARRVPPHARPGLLALAARARWAAVARCGAGSEWVLGELAASSLPDEAWLRAIGAWASAQVAAVRRDGANNGGLQLTAILVLQTE
jgi:hypothetical protein